MNLDRKQCPICNTYAMKSSFFATSLDYILKKRFTISTCKKCGHGITDLDTKDQPFDNSLYKGGNYDIKEKIWHRLLTPFLIILERSKLKYLSRLNNSGKRLLEVGCGKGRFLQIAKRKGYEVYGFEPSVRSSFFARSRLGDVVFPVGIENINEVKALKGGFDIIVLWHVIEHLQNPDVVLKIIKKLLTTNGEILIAVPNLSSYQAKLGTGNWYHLDTPRHLQHFTPQSLRILLERNGFKIEHVYFNSLYQNYLGEILTLTNKFLPDKNVLLNLMRFNKYYIKSVGWQRASVMLTMAFLITGILSIPTLLWTFVTQIVSRAGTMIFIVKSS